MSEAGETSALDLATELTIAWLGNPNTRASAEDVPAFLERMHAAVNNLSAPAQAAEEVAATPAFTPAVSVRKSLASKDHIISLIDGKPYKTLKRHLSGHGLTPEQYRERYNLRADYPMVAESYAEMRRGLAKKIGLGAGKKKAETSAPPAAAKNAETSAPPAAAKKAGGRRRKAAVGGAPEAAAEG